MKIKAFNIVENNLKEYFSKLGFKLKKAGDLETLFFKNEEVYKLEYLESKKEFKLLYANNSLNSLKDEDFSVSAVWYFDAETDTEKEAKSIANDFVETLSQSSSKPKINKKAPKTDSQKINDIIFFINRLVTIFPELKDDIKYEREHYENFRGVTFCKKKILPLVLALLKENTQKDKIKKLCTTLNNLYENGDLDVRAVITIVFLNSIEDERSKEIVKKELSKDLSLAWQAALKYKGKKVKPERAAKRFNLFAAAREQELAGRK